ncbi:glycosyltransferase [Robertmurraya mangrovi]|nr:glycosyltransferase [Bacillus sp. 31A1R]
MRVLQINSVCGIGSTGRIATDLDRFLKESGHDSFIAYGRNMAKNCDSAIRIGSKLDNYIHVAETRIFDRHGLGSINATKKFIRTMEKLNPDIIHLHNIHGYYLNIKYLLNYLKSSEKPVVWTLHDCWAFTGHCAYFDFVDCSKWKTGCSSCPQKESYPSSFLFDNSSENYRVKRELTSELDNLSIVTPSRWLARLVKQSFLRKHPIKVINNGIDLQIFKPTHSDFRKTHNLENKFIILGVANIWDRRKGFNFFLELSKKISENDIMVLVGLNEEQIKNLPKNIIGFKKTESIYELTNLYSVADVFVNPTLEDNFPTTNLEALACGTPVITFNTGGSIESIDDTCGMVVEKGDMKRLVGAIEQIKEREPNNLREQCLNRSKLFNKNLRFQEYLELYKSIIISTSMV